MTTLRVSRSSTRSAVAALAAAGVALAGPVAAMPGADAASAKPKADSSFSLPDGFQPEGIAISGRTAYFGSLADGSIYAYDLKKQDGTVISDGPGTASVGLKVEPKQNRLYVSGGDAGTARVLDAGTGDVLADYTLTEGPAFINDVVLTDRAAYFTNSSAPEIYRVPVTRSGSLAPAKRVRTITLRKEWVQPEGFGANGITETPDGKALLVVNSADGTLFKVARQGKRAGKARQVDLGGVSLENGDGMLLENRTLSVVRNQNNVVVQIDLDRRGLTGTKAGVLRSPSFDVPTTIAASGKDYYLPNARFTTPPTPTTPYTVSVVKKS